MNPNPKVTSYTPAAVSANGIAVNLTGAGPYALASSGAGDGLEHQVSLQSAANLSAVNVTVAGTDANDNVISETRAGPNINTVSTTKYFKTVTSITTSGTLGASTMNVGWSAVCRTRFEQIDYYQNSFAVSHALSLIAGTINFDLQHTYDPLTDSNGASVFNDAAAQTASKDLGMLNPVRGVRVNVNSNTGATFKHCVFQGARS